MKSDIIIQLHKNFEDFAQQIDGEEFWLARDSFSLIYHLEKIPNAHTTLLQTMLDRVKRQSSQDLPMETASPPMLLL